MTPSVLSWYVITLNNPIKAKLSCLNIVLTYVQVGTSMGAVAMFLIKRNIDLLSGRALNPKDTRNIISVLRANPHIKGVYDVKTQTFGPGISSQYMINKLIYILTLIFCFCFCFFKIFKLFFLK